MLKKFFAMALCVMLLLSLAAGAAADAGNPVFDCWAVDDDSVYCFAAPGESSDVSVSAAGTPLAVASVTTVEQSDLPVTYICMIDQSSAYSTSQKNQQQEGVSALRAGLRPQDKLVVVSMNADTSFSGVLTDSDQWDAAIDEALVYKAFTTNLYHDLITMVDRVSDSEKYPGMRCVVMFTDGINDQMLSDTIDQAREALNDFRFSLHTFVVMDPYAGDYALQNAARMEELSALTPGGICVAPQRDDATPADSVNKIIQQVLSTPVIQLDAAQLDRSAGAVELTVSLGGKTGAVSVPTAQLPELPPATEPETTAPEAETTETVVPWPDATETAASTEAQWVVATDSSDAPQTQKSNTAFYSLIGGGIAAIVVAALAVILLSRRRRDKKDAAPEDDEDLEFMTPEDAQEAVYSDLDVDPIDLSSLDLKSDFASLYEEGSDDYDFFNIPKITPDPVPDLEPKAAPKAAPEAAPDLEPKAAPKAAPRPAPDLEPKAAPIRNPGCTVRLTPEDFPDEPVEFFLETNASVTLGRTGRANVILNEVDTSLSGVHMEIQWDGRALHLRDCNSTNGTQVNGVPVKPGVWVRLENGMFVEAGSTRYRVYVQKK